MKIKLKHPIDQMRILVSIILLKHDNHVRDT